jgi:4-diphosphocytidyl-2-C-methyl-D-erythritol kinase
MTPDTLVLRPFAKINLTLDVGPRRSDGFHDVRTLMQAIALTDRLVLTRRRGPFTLSTSAAGLPADRSNLVYRAAERLWRAMGRDGQPRDLAVQLSKRIPMAAGLGGGSADAAATLVGAHRLWRAKLPLAALMAIGAELGSDVPFFLCGGTAFGLGRGEDLVPARDAAPLDVVVLTPAFGVSTAEAYRWFDEDGAHGRPAGRRAQTVDLGWPTGPVALFNSLQHPVSRRHPEIEVMVRACLRAGAQGAAMSGSGSAVFGLFTKGEGRRAASTLERRGWTCRLSRTLGLASSRRLMGLAGV